MAHLLLADVDFSGPTLVHVRDADQAAAVARYAARRFPDRARFAWAQGRLRDFVTRKPGARLLKRLAGLVDRGVTPLMYIGPGASARDMVRWVTASAREGFALIVALEDGTPVPPRVLAVRPQIIVMPGAYSPAAGHTDDGGVVVVDRRGARRVVPVPGPAAPVYAGGLNDAPRVTAADFAAYRASGTPRGTPGLSAAALAAFRRGDAPENFLGVDAHLRPGFGVEAAPEKNTDAGESNKTLGAAFLGASRRWAKWIALAIFAIVVFVLIMRVVDPALHRAIGSPVDGAFRRLDSYTPKIEP